MANTNYLSLSLSSLALKNSPELQTIALKKINQDYITYYEYYPGSIMTLHIEDGFFALNRSDSKIKLSEDNKTITADYVYLRDNFDKISINLSDTFFKAANANLNFYDTLTISLDDEELNSQYGKTVSIYADNYEASFFKKGNKYSFINSLKGLTASNFKSNATFKNKVYTNTKVIDAEKSPTNKKDDNLCWAATASNMLTWTQWADQGLNLKNKTNKEDLVFQEFIKNFTNKGSHQSFGIDWFFDGSYEKSNDLSWSQPAKDSGNYLQRTSQPYITYFSEIDPLNFISHLISGEAVGLSIRPTDGSGSWHAITCFGFEFNPKLAFTDKNFLCGIYITDSDDEKTSKNPSDTLVYLPVSWNNKNKCYIFTDVDYNQDYYLEDFTTLERYQTATHQNTTKIIKVNESEISSQQEILKSNLQVVYPQASSENEIISGGESLILNEASSKNSLIIAGKQVVYGLSQDSIVQAEGTLAIFEGGISENARIENLGLEVIYAKGQAQNTTVTSGGRIQVLSGGLALNANINQGGREEIKGKDSKAQIFGTQVIFKGGLAQNTRVKNQGLQQIKGQAQNTSVDSGGRVEVLAGGSALNLKINQGGREEVKGKDSKAQIFGTQVISKGGQAQNTTVTSGGRVEVLAGGLALNLNINKGGKVITFSQGKDSKAQIFGSHVVQRGGSSYQAQIVKNGVQEVLGLTQETTVKAQGLLTIKNQGLASKVTLHSQSLLQIAKGGQIKEIFAKKGAQIEAKSKASLADLTLQSGALCNLDGQVNLSGKNTFKAKATLIGGSSQNLVKLKSGSINLQGDNLLTKFYLETGNSTLNIAGSNNKLGYLKVSKKTTINYKLANLDPKKDTTLLSLVKLNKQKIGSYQIYLTKNQNLGSYKLSNHLIPAKNQNFTIYLNNKKLGTAKINDKALEKRGFSLKLSLNKNLIKFSVKLQAGQILKPQASNFNLKGSQASDIFYTDKNNNTITGVDGRDVVIYNSFNWGKDIIKKTNGTINIVFCGLASSKISTKKEGSNLVVSTTQNKNSKITISNWNDQTHKLVYAKKLSPLATTGQNLLKIRSEIWQKAKLTAT